MVAQVRQSFRNKARHHQGKARPVFLAYAELVSRALMAREDGAWPLHVNKAGVERLALAIQNHKSKD